MHIVMGLVGIISLVLIAVIFSSNRKAINIRTVVGAFAIQAAIAAFVIMTPFGSTVLQTVSSGVQAVMDSANDGIAFLFGGLVSGKMFEVFGGGGFVFAFKVLPVIIFFAAFMGVLYHVGLMQFIIKIFGGALQKLLGTSRTESMSAAANVFVGQTEAPLLVKPYIKNMTQSELFAVMCGGLASVAGAVLVGYASLGVSLDYLIAASFMAAPGGLLMAKLLHPETEKPNNDIIEGEEEAESKPVNVIDAAAAGASSGLQLALNVGAMLIAFIALISLVNIMLGAFGGLFGLEALSLQQILGYVFAPIAFLIGIPWSEATAVGSLLGQKLVVNEFVAFIDFVGMKDTLSAHSQVIVTVALCGFANLSSMAILLGGLGVLAPSRRPDIARLGLKAVLAGTLSNFMSAALVGIFFSISGAALIG
ncbi:NupC/NupG family nucleoside CNT transporter [Psychromonas sp. Urea-02u-13]|uniref:NupC/NupG family nucleoside CNT transporter n=1 Tax=Psychromonas sp. Urea-02u-13 TaxID=2058326 RepID=UPI000C32F740|nr:NupC/NupG family nucleoside CNT transporter [Psychromonas sp. Urea-02u-13]PKG37808.1 NupC/NupG family nucleoside CNT transporter [Psychromonas sp. Urea-02u-13]